MDMDYIGIDGCRAGWVCVGLSADGGFAVNIIPTVDSIEPWLESAALVLIDVPIGLQTTGVSGRHCDLAARKMIKPRGSTVFPAPARSAAYKDTYEDACDENERCLGKRIPRQAFGICPKIREVDEFMRRIRPRSKVREMHPEVAFCGLNGMTPLLTRKKDSDGFAERKKLLNDLDARARSVIELARKIENRQTYLADDDILDALVGAVTASRYPDLQTLPLDPPTDDEGLAMEMVYSDSSRSGPSSGQPLERA